ncbi:tripartite tricarboxylate transporter permease [Candidatus Woesearchaeota archaeon]|nr:tripartite tricarboxylate transporter permease [Candidatus Woesearchaeota archaeon]
MIVEIIIAVLVGIIGGVFSGLTPGIHTNLLVTLLFSASPFLLTFTTPLVISTLIVSMAITHTFLNVLPAVYLGAPDSEGKILSVLPGHRMLLQGKGYEAVTLTVLGSFLAIIIGILLTPLLLKFLPGLYSSIKNYIGYLLVIISIYMVLRERKKFWAFFIFILAGIFGLGVLNLNIKEPLFPLLSSLFGVAGLLISLKDNVKIPKQIIEKITIPKKEVAKAMSSAGIVGTFVSLMPGLGPAQAAIIGSQLIKLTDKGFLILVGSLETLGMITSFIAIFSIQKARNGAVVVISRLMETITQKDLILFLIVAFIAGLIAVFLSLSFAKIFSSLITKVNYQKLCIAIIILIVGMALWLSSYLGLFVLIIGSFIGMLPSLVGIGKNHLMGCLLLPIILFFLL